MVDLYAGKGASRYRICITDKALPKNLLNKYIDRKAKVFIVTDSGVPKAYIKNLKQIIKASSVYIHEIKNGDPEEILTKLQNDREELYKSVADHVVDTEKKSSQEVASEIVKLVKS